jgi:hypothetical protein
MLGWDSNCRPDSLWKSLLVIFNLESHVAGVFALERSYSSTCRARFAHVVALPLHPRRIRS